FRRQAGKRHQRIVFWLPSQTRPRPDETPVGSFDLLSIFDTTLSLALLRAERFSYWFPYRVSVRTLDTAFAIFRTRLLRISGHGFRRAVSRFRTRISAEIILKSEVIAGVFLLAGAGVTALLTADQAEAFEGCQMLIERR